VCVWEGEGGCVSSRESPQEYMQSAEYQAGCDNVRSLLALLGASLWAKEIPTLQGSTIEQKACTNEEDDLQKVEFRCPYVRWVMVVVGWGYPRKQP